MAFLTQRIIQSALRAPSAIRAAQERAEPEVVVLPVRDGCAPSERPPVRIFLGTEAAQYKAERVFIWSIERVRDPSRVYEIHLMKHLYGFRSRFWLTGFTNYRFAIPHFAGRTGRAIYNDVDQIYLKDPAELFDLDLHGHGYLAIDPGDISVALFDCERMSRVWTLEDARTGRKNELLARASRQPGLWGELAGGWNARDREYVPGECGVLHYTALHRQPWHPFPKLFVYQANRAADVWFDLEQSANAAGFQAFSLAHPSRAFGTLCQAVRNAVAGSWHEAGRSGAQADFYPADLRPVLAESRVGTVLDCRIAAIAPRPPASALADAGVGRVVPFDPTEAPGESDQEERLDAVVCTGTLEFVPDDDVPWMLDRLFGRARRLVYCHVFEPARDRQSAARAGIRHRERSAEWWQYQFELVARKHPRIRWRLCLYQGRDGRRGRPLIIEGNEYDRGDATVWVLANQKPGHTSQATALAEAVGWPYRLISVPQRLKALVPVLLHLDGGRVEPLRPPWPSVIVACGWWPTRVARWVQKRSGGRVRLLLAGRKCGPVRSGRDILVSCEHFHLPVHARRIETLLPIHPITESRLSAARQRGLQLIGDAASPRVALLAGGSSKQHLLTAADAASMGRRVLEQVRAAGGSLFAVTSRRTGSAAAAALASSLQGSAKLHTWSRDEVDNPYLNYLAAADILIVTGESESMLMDAIATGKPVYIYPLRQRRYGPWLSIGARLSEWSERRPKNRRGTERPQQGFEYLCSRILAREWILPPRDIEGLHRRLVEEGLARMFDASLSDEPPIGTPTSGDLGRRLRIMLAQPQYEEESSAAASQSIDLTLEA
ncbi:MAG: ELM1/GtrOC1 family putative glycosyltransferase [Gammaproteobacteria bacterium]